jgi:tRNA A58 N-methylase Trm61
VKNLLLELSIFNSGFSWYTPRLIEILYRGTEMKHLRMRGGTAGVMHLQQGEKMSRREFP